MEYMEYVEYVEYVEYIEYMEYMEYVEYDEYVECVEYKEYMWICVQAAGASTGNEGGNLPYFQYGESSKLPVRCRTDSPVAIPAFSFSLVTSGGTEWGSARPRFTGSEGGLSPRLSQVFTEASVHREWGERNEVRRGSPRVTTRDNRGNGMRFTEASEWGSLRFTVY